MFAPTDSEYVSEVRTEEARQAAQSAVEPVYTSPDPIKGRQQIERLDITLQYITSVRDDASISYQEKKNNLTALSDVRLDPKMIDFALSISAARWEAVRAESLRVLEQIVRRAIYAEDLERTKKTSPL